MPVHVVRHRRLLRRVTEQHQFRLNPRQSPRGVLPRHAPDQTTDLRVDLRAAWFLPRLQAPVEPEAVAMPADDRLGLDDYEAGLPVCPKPRQPHPENPITLPKPRAPHRALEDAELVAKSQVFGRDGGAVCEERPEEQEDRTYDARFASSIRVL